VTTNAARILSEDNAPRVRAKGSHHQSVDSSNVKHWEYRASTLELVVTFLGGEIYRYRNVGPKTWAALAKAKSKGEALARLVIDKFPFTKVK
jgi:hypothetical protein